MENCVDAPSSLGVAMPGVNEAFAVAPAARVLAQLPQVSQVRVFSSLSSTVAPAGGGAGAGAGAGLGEAPLAVGALGLELGLPPQEVIVNVNRMVRTETARKRNRIHSRGKTGLAKLAQSL